VDRVVDYMIALESTLVPEHDFVGRRLRERAARLLHDDRGAEDKIKDLIRKFYDIRSTIAHGSPLSGRQRKILTDRSEEFERSVREVLVEALKQLPADQNKRKGQLAELWPLTDEERAAKLTQDFNAIRSDEVKRDLLARLNANTSKSRETRRRET
jgi:hypothetical protein